MTTARNLWRIFAALIFAAATASAQTINKNVQKDASTGALTESLSTGNKTLTVASGGTITAASGSTVNLTDSTLSLPAQYAIPSLSGQSGKTLSNNGSALTWATASGDVTGPASATDNAIVRFDATTGKLLQNSAAIISDAGDLSATGAIIAGAATTSAPSFRAPHGTAPTSPTNGDLWTTTSGLFARINGATVGPYGTGNITTTTVDGYFADPSTNASFAASVWRSDLGLVIGTNVAPATSGTSIVYGNGSGGFSNATVGGNLSFTAGTLNLSTTPNIGAATGTSLSLTGNATISGATDVTQGSDATGAVKISGGASVSKGLNVGFGGTSNTYTITAGGNGGTNYVGVGGGAAAKVEGFAAGGAATTLQLNPGGGPVVVGGNLSLTTGAGVLSIANNSTAGLVVGTTRPLTYTASTGIARIQGESGPWAVQYGFAGSAGTALGGFGAFGGTDALTYYWIGADHTSPAAQIDSTQTRVNATTNATNTTSGALRIGSNVGLSGTAGGSSYFGGPIVTVAPTTSLASLNLPHGTTPSSPTNGDVWTTTSAMFARINGATVDITTTPVLIGVACSDETTAITTGTAKVTFRAPYAFTLTAVRATLTTVSSSGTPTVDINEAGTSVLSTKLTIDANEKTSTTAATAAVISDSAIADDAEITIDIDTAGTGAAGLKVWLIGTR